MLFCRVVEVMTAAILVCDIVLTASTSIWIGTSSSNGAPTSCVPSYPNLILDDRLTVEIQTHATHDCSIKIAPTTTRNFPL